MLRASASLIVTTIDLRRKQGSVMGSESKTLANEVVEAFQGLLDSDVREAVGKEHFHALSGMIREAIAEQSEAILERLERNLSQVKAEMVERRPLEL